mgnify:CR=1 FL=1
MAKFSKTKKIVYFSIVGGTLIIGTSLFYAQGMQKGGDFNELFFEGLLMFGLPLIFTLTYLYKKGNAESH